MDPICEELMIESIKEMDDMDDDIYSESMFYLVDQYIDDYVEESMSNIFNSDSENTVYSALNDLINNANIQSQETDSENDNDYSYIDWAPVVPDDDCTEEDLRDEFYIPSKIKDSSRFVQDTDTGVDYNYDSLFGDNQ